jgi:nickel-dependent lactate racemase
MTQAQFHRVVFFHYHEAARGKRLHIINDRIEYASGETLKLLKKEREKIFQEINKETLATEPEWNGREALREPIDREKMLKVLNDVKKRE